ncbi:hypothetical protein CHS0354_014097 [Potamilus streckersoni]|uniref:Uncharacterized protein n=1 Tax=Potamilus streckersoni TaxID=2493646 RepID=A0AAE0TJX1_9BIVA|nr:hypothetical protein CHS0354_014097 [Potamilus streckersoni]
MEGSKQESIPQNAINDENVNQKEAPKNTKANHQYMVEPDSVEYTMGGTYNILIRSTDYESIMGEQDATSTKQLEWDNFLSSNKTGSTINEGNEWKHTGEKSILSPSQSSRGKGSSLEEKDYGEWLRFTTQVGETILSSGCRWGVASVYNPSRGEHHPERGL